MEDGHEEDEDDRRYGGERTQPFLFHLFYPWRLRLRLGLLLKITPPSTVKVTLSSHPTNLATESPQSFPPNRTNHASASTARSKSNTLHPHPIHRPPLLLQMLPLVILIIYIRK